MEEYGVPLLPYTSVKLLGLLYSAPEIFEACPCNILHSFNLRLNWFSSFFWNYSVFLSLCCWVETECIAVGGATTCAHAQYVLDVNLIHAGLWRHGSSLIPIIVYLLCQYVNDQLCPSEHSTTSKAKSHAFFHWPIPARSMSGAMLCTPSQKSVGARGCVWLCWLRPEGFWIGGTVFLPITVA